MLNRMKSAAYQQFKSEYTEKQFNELFAGGKTIICVWRISEGTQNKLFVTQYDTQINYNTLKEEGFTENAKPEKLFYVDRQTKSVEFVGTF